MYKRSPESFRWAYKLLRPHIASPLHRQCSPTRTVLAMQTQRCTCTTDTCPDILSFIAATARVPHWRMSDNMAKCPKSSAPTMVLCGSDRHTTATMLHPLNTMPRRDPMPGYCRMSPTQTSRPGEDIPRAILSRSICACSPQSASCRQWPCMPHADADRRSYEAFATSREGPLRNEEVVITPRRDFRLEALGRAPKHPRMAPRQCINGRVSTMARPGQVK